MVLIPHITHKYGHCFIVMLCYFNKSEWYIFYYFIHRKGQQQETIIRQCSLLLLHFLKPSFFKWDLQNAIPFSKHMSISRKYTHHGDVPLTYRAIVYVPYTSLLLDEFYNVTNDCVSKDSLYIHVGTWLFIESFNHQFCMPLWSDIAHHTESLLEIKMFINVWFTLMLFSITSL